MKRNKSSKTAFDLMRHYELKKFLEGIPLLACITLLIKFLRVSTKLADSQGKS